VCHDADRLARTALDPHQVTITATSVVVLVAFYAGTLRVFERFAGGMHPRYRDASV